MARLLDEGEIRLVDVGVAGDELFLSHKSYGFLDQIQEAVEEGRRQPRDRIRRLLAYYGTAVRAVWRTPLAPLGVEVDGALAADQAVLVTVANVETYRDFLSLTPSRFAGRWAPRRLRDPADLEVGPGVAAAPAQAAPARPLEGRLDLPRARGRRREPRPGARRCGWCGGCCPCVLPPGAIEQLKRRQLEGEEEVPLETVA